MELGKFKCGGILPECITIFGVNFDSFSIGVGYFDAKLVADLSMGGPSSSILLGSFKESLMLSHELEEAPGRIVEKPMVMAVQACCHGFKLGNFSEGFPGRSTIIPVDVDVPGGLFVVRVVLFEGTPMVRKLGEPKYGRVSIRSGLVLF